MHVANHSQSTTRSISVCNCVDTTLYTCTTSPPVLAGDCRGIRLAPNGSFHHRDLPILAQASFPGVSNQRQSPGSLEDDGAGDALPHNFWGEPVEDNGRDHHYVNLGAGASKPKGANWSLLPADEFLPALVPYQDTNPNPGTGVVSHKASSLDMRQYPRWRRLPQPYASVAQTRAAKALSLQKTIEASGRFGTGGRTPSKHALAWRRQDACQAFCVDLFRFSFTSWFVCCWRMLVFYRYVFLLLLLFPLWCLLSRQAARLRKSRTSKPLSRMNSWTGCMLKATPSTFTTGSRT